MKASLDSALGRRSSRSPACTTWCSGCRRWSPAADDEAAVYNLNLFSATGTGILVAAIIGGLVLGYSPGGLVRMYGRTLYLVRYSLLTIACMLALGYVTRYSGTDATLGLAFAQTGWLYPFFGTLLGWLGVALTGSDTASNVLFGGLQKITAAAARPQPDPDGARPTARAASWAR